MHGCLIFGRITETSKYMFYNMFQAKMAFMACVYEKKAVTLWAF